MDSWMPWVITRNFIRAFFPTLVLVITWNLCRNLLYLKSARTWAVTTDLVALCVVIAIRLAPPLAPALEQLKYVVDKQRLGLAAIFIALISFKLELVGLDPLLLVGGCVFCNDLSRLRRSSLPKARQLAGDFSDLAGFIILFVAALISSLRQTMDGTYSWREISVAALAILAMVFAGWWANRHPAQPFVQELGPESK